ncbi:MAG: glycosyltransferase [Methylacidiphilales bacterium]|nr:glycosyltransferase [Candidatus Methylacidiphilales bacterium]
MNANEPQICLVAGSLQEPSGCNPAGGHFLRLARLCRTRFGSVTVLYTGPDAGLRASIERSLSSSGIHLVRLERLPLEPHDKAYWGFINQSLAVYDFLKKQDYTHVLFQEHRGIGFRSVQARRMAGDFQNTLLMLAIFDPSERSLEAGETWPRWPIPAALASWCERYVCEHADLVVFGSDEIKRRMVENQWPVPTDNRVLPFFTDRLKSQANLKCNRPELDPLEQEWLELFKKQAAPTNKHDVIRSKIALNPPLVSVVIAHYNHGRYLPETLASLEKSAYPNFEVIVVDDGSTDGFSLRVFHELQEQYPAPRYTFIAKSKNQGIGASRNHGAALAKGDYLVFVDADNIVLPEMLESFIEGIELSGVDCCTCFYKAFEDRPDPLRIPWVVTPAGQAMEAGWVEDVFGDANCIVRRQVFLALQGFPEVLLLAEDWEFFINLSRSGYKLDVIPRFLFWYRDNPTGCRRSGSRYQKYKAILDAYASGLPEFYRRILKQIAYPLASDSGYPPQRWLWHELEENLKMEHRSLVQFTYFIIKQIEQFVRRKYLYRIRFNRRKPR